MPVLTIAARTTCVGRLRFQLLGTSLNLLQSFTALGKKAGKGGKKGGKKGRKGKGKGKGNEMLAIEG